MYKGIIENEIRLINPETNELGISETLSTALTREGYPDIFCLGIFNGGERMFEGVLMDGVNIGDGPLLRFTYDWDTDEFIEL